MEFKEAYQLLDDIHSQCGDVDWRSHKEEAKYATEKYANYTEWEGALSWRSDISDDKKWSLECFDSTFKVLFALMGKV